MIKPERILHLTLKKVWFELIRDGIKIEEYREIKPYWTRRLDGKEFDFVVFRNGYGRDVPTIKVELKAISIGRPFPPWTESPDQCYILKLGKVVFNSESS